MINKIRFAFLGALVVTAAALIFGAQGGSFSTQAVAQSTDSSVYPQVGIRTGVYNDGKAALWDLNIWDHFNYFGPRSAEQDGMSVLSLVRS
jgi:hypothetical protein